MGCNKWRPTPGVHIAGLVREPFFARRLAVVLVILISNVLQVSYVSLTDQ